MISNLLPKILPRNDQQREAEFKRSLLRREAEIGGTLFGPLPKGHHRQFFCLDRHTWVWHEEWTANGRQQVLTTRYEVRPGVGVIKYQDGQPAQHLSLNEARNFYVAVGLYQQKVDADYERLLQTL